MKMRGKIKTIIICFLFIVSCLEALWIFQIKNNGTFGKAAIADNATSFSMELTDFYQLFYGEWIVESIVPNETDKTENDEFIGTKISIQRNIVSVNDEKWNSQPNFICAIVPSEYFELYAGKAAPLNPEKVTHKDSPYFVSVFIQGNNDNDPLYRWLNHFYVYDENTLIFCGMSEGKTRFYRAIRMDSIEDYLIFIGEG